MAVWMGCAGTEESGGLKCPFVTSVHWQVFVFLCFLVTPSPGTVHFVPVTGCSVSLHYQLLWGSMWSCARVRGWLWVPCCCPGCRRLSLPPVLGHPGCPALGSSPAGPVPSSVLLLAQEKPSLPLVCRVRAACFELLQQLQLSIPKAQGEPWLEQGLPRALPALPVLQFGLWAALFFPCPGAGISLLRAGFTGGYLGRVPHSSLLRT